MSLDVSDQECNSGKKYGQKGTLCGPNNARKLKYIAKCIPSIIWTFISYVFYFTCP
jgi:hypothetical protein